MRQVRLPLNFRLRGSDRHSGRWLSGKSNLAATFSKFMANYFSDYSHRRHGGLLLLSESEPPRRRGRRCRAKSPMKLCTRVFIVSACLLVFFRFLRIFSHYLEKFFYNKVNFWDFHFLKNAPGPRNGALVLPPVTVIGDVSSILISFFMFRIIL